MFHGRVARRLERRAPGCVLPPAHALTPSTTLFACPLHPAALLSYLLCLLAVVHTLPPLLSDPLHPYISCLCLSLAHYPPTMLSYISTVYLSPLPLLFTHLPRLSALNTLPDLLFPPLLP